MKNNKELTPMMELIEKFKDAQKNIIANTDYAKGYDGALSDCIANLEASLPREKEFNDKFFAKGYLSRAI